MDLKTLLTINKATSISEPVEAFQIIDNPNAIALDLYYTDKFGYSVATCLSYYIVGAYNEGDIGGSGSGKAYIYNNATGALLWTLDNPSAYGTSYDDRFGYSVAITESYSIVGAYEEDDAGGTRSGKAYIFDNSTGLLLYTLDNPNDFGTSASDFFGQAVAICESYSIVGAAGEDDSIGNDSGKSYIFDNATGLLLYTLDNPNAYSTPDYDNFGNSVAICESYAIVGAHKEADVDGTQSGKAYIFDNSTGLLLYTLDNPNPFGTSLNDHFGFAVSISELYSIAGAYWEGDASGAYSGKAYIYDNSTGLLLYTLDNPNPYSTSTDDQFGFSVGITDTHAIVGAAGEDSVSGTEIGKAYIYDNSTGLLLYTLDNPADTSNMSFGWSVATFGSYSIVGCSGYTKAYIFNNTTGELVRETVNPNPYGTTTYDTFGYSSGIAGSYFVVGAIGELNDLGDDASGMAYIFSSSTGELLHTLENPNPDLYGAYDEYGWSVASSNTYSIVSSYEEDSYSGKAYIYNNSTGALLWTLDNPNDYDTPGSDQFGYSTSICESYSIVGANGEDAPSASNSGRAYIFDNSTGVLLYTLDNPNDYDTLDGDNFGKAVAICESYSIVGAPDEDDVGGTSSGKAYIFDNSTGLLLWTLDNPNAYDVSLNDQFGTSVAITESYSIVGAPYEDDIDGSNSGKAYIYDNSTGVLLHTLDNPNAYGTSANDQFGKSVAINESYSVVGATGEGDVDGTYSGKVYIYDNSTGVLLHTLDNPNAYGTSANDYFGSALAISNTYILVGAYNEDDEDGIHSGKAYKYSIASLV